MSSSRKDTLVCTLVAVLFVAMLAGMMWFQFRIYQRKHGSHMTFIEFLFDAETK